MATDQPSSDELITQALAGVSERRRSISESMAKAAHDQVVERHEFSYEMQQVGLPAGQSLIADSGDVDEIVASLAPERSRRPASPTPSRRRRASQSSESGTDIRPVEATNPFKVERNWRKRIPGLAALAALALWFILGNLGGAIDAVGEFFVSERDSVPAVNDADITNLAWQQAATASGTYQGQGPFRAVDGDPESAWNSGGYPEQWVIVDLDGRSTLTSVRLLVGQFPQGPTVHQLIGWGPDVEDVVLHEFIEETADGDWLEVTFDEPIAGISQVAVVTFSSPSWVAWREVEIHGIRSSTEST